VKKEEFADMKERVNFVGQEKFTETNETERKDEKIVRKTRIL
jgi:hypothetical protein